MDNETLILIKYSCYVLESYTVVSNPSFETVINKIISDNFPIKWKVILAFFSWT